MFFHKDLGAPSNLHSGNQKKLALHLPYINITALPERKTLLQNFLGCALLVGWGLGGCLPSVNDIVNDVNAHFAPSNTHAHFFIKQETPTSC